MYQYSVPVISRHLYRSDLEKVTENLMNIGARRVFLAIGVYETNEEKRAKTMALLKEHAAFFHDKGFEVGSWMWTFWDSRADSPYMRIKSVTGNDSAISVCPSDASFRKFAAGYVQDVARCGVDVILFDDDYRFGHLDKNSGLGCVCENHVRDISRRLGEDVTSEKLYPYLMTGGANRYRSAWQESKRESLLQFAYEMRAALDEVNPSVRMGVCACMSDWDFDGVSADEISRALAGNTKPLLRLIGAPYWAVRRSFGGNRLQDVIEAERMERSFCQDGIEIIAEGDTYPRPRFICPAGFLEGFDQVLRADGKLDGCLKYMIDYSGSHRYETGYIKRHVANLPLYEKIDDFFGDKECVGVRVWEHKKKYEDMEIPSCVKTEKDILTLFFSPAARILAASAIPTVYEGDGIGGMACGENGKYLPLDALRGGMILDLRAAELLRDRGVDVGLCQRGDAFASVGAEYFPKREEYPRIEKTQGYRCVLSEKAEVESFFLTEANERVPASYRYENEKGEKFLVYCFDAYLADDSLLRHYERGHQIADAMEWFGKPLPTAIFDNPDLYVLTKEKDGVYATGLWNFCIDSIEEPELILSADARVLRTIGCEVEKVDNVLRLSRIEPYGFAAVEWTMAKR